MTFAFAVGLLAVCARASLVEVVATGAHTRASTRAQRSDTVHASEAELRSLVAQLRAELAEVRDRHRGELETARAHAASLEAEVQACRAGQAANTTQVAGSLIQDATASAELVATGIRWANQWLWLRGACQMNKPGSDPARVCEKARGPVDMAQLSGQAGLIVFDALGGDLDGVLSMDQFLEHGPAVFGPTFRTALPLPSNPAEELKPLATEEDWKFYYNFMKNPVGSENVEINPVQKGQQLAVARGDPLTKKEFIKYYMHQVSEAPGILGLGLYPIIVLTWMLDSS